MKELNDDRPDPPDPDNSSEPPGCLSIEPEEDSALRLSFGLNFIASLGCHGNLFSAIFLFIA